MPVKRQVFGHAFRKQDVTAVAAIHHPLRDVDSTASQVRSIVYIGHFVYWPTVDAHAQAEVCGIFQCLGNFHSTPHRRFRTGKKDQHHSITGRQPNQFVRRFRGAKLTGTPDDLI